MPSTFTTGLRLEKQADGENENTWGDIVNRQLDLLDTAITGQTTIVTTGGNTILTQNNGQADQARAAIILVQGALTADALILFPAEPRLLYVHNACSGINPNTNAPYNVYLNPAGNSAAGNEIAIPAGYGGYFFNSGTAIAPIGGSTGQYTGSQYVGGNTVVTGSSTIEGSFNDANLPALYEVTQGSQGQVAAGANRAVGLSVFNSVVAPDFCAVSDARTKSEITDLTVERAEAFVREVPGIEHAWRNRTGRAFGYLAQDVVAAGFTELVTQISDPTMAEDGPLSPAGRRWVMDYDKVSPLHSVLLRHLLEERDALTARVEALEALLQV